MAPFDRPYTTFYWLSIVKYSSVTYQQQQQSLFLSYLTLNTVVTLKSGLEVNQGHSNWYHSKAWVQFPIPIL